jgi:hypothetical protein
MFQKSLPAKPLSGYPKTISRFGVHRGFWGFRIGSDLSIGRHLLKNLEDIHGLPLASEQYFSVER